ncbi:MAG: glycosyltransferase [Methylocystis sp.]
MRAVAHIVQPKIIGVTENLRAPLTRMFSNRRIDVISNGVDLRRFTRNRGRARSILNIDLRARVIGAAGRLEFVKGYDLLLEAFSLLPSDVVLVIAGHGSQRAALDERALSLRVADRVKFLGHRDDVAELYGAFDVFCQPARNEGLPLAVLEAQACGVPVVGTLVGDMASAICPESGRLVEPEKVGALATALDNALARADVLSPRQFIADRFNWRDTLEGYTTALGV